MTRTILQHSPALPRARRWQTRFCLWLAVLALSASSVPARAEPNGKPASPALETPGSQARFNTGLQAPEQRSTRFSAYSLPKGMWELDAGALGISSGDLYGRLGVARGFGHGLQLDLNLLHWSVGLFGFDARWAFLETRYIALSAGVGFMYGHGAWIWILNDTAQKILADSDVLAASGSVTASSSLTRWLQLDLMAQYQYAEYFGKLGSGRSFYAESQLGVRQVMLRPTMRVFASDATAFEFAAKLPAYTHVPYQSDATLDVGNRERSGSASGYAAAKFKDSWNIELGVRSRLRPWLYATVRLHYGQVSKALYGASLYPSFGLEFRL